MRMRNSLSIAILSVLLVVGAFAAPRPTPELRYTSAVGVEEPFSVSFQAGAVSACTVFTSQVERIVLDGVDQPYAPRNCWMLDERSTGYTDAFSFVQPNGGKWDVRVEVWWPETPYDAPVLSNIVTVVH